MSAKKRLLHTGLDPSAVERALASSRGSIASAHHGSSTAEVLDWLDCRPCDLLLLGRGIEGLPLERFVEEALRGRPDLNLLMLARPPDYGEAARLGRLGVRDYVPWEPDDDAHVSALLNEVLTSQPPGESDEEDELPDLVGRSEAIRAVARLIRLVAPRRATVLITGRTGTGKEVVARAIHAASPRARQPMVIVNCGAIPTNLMEAELFGHVKGAFTGAVSNRLGRFEMANGGDIFLDEVAELPLEVQSKLLRVLQERQFERVGSSETVRVDVRVIAAANCDLRQKVEKGEFREDLYYRLNVVPVFLPPLAARAGDIPLLAAHLTGKICLRESLRPKRISPEAIERLKHYSWPGNVRQLENAVEKAVVLSGERCLLMPSDFPLPPAPRLANGNLESGLRLPPEGMDLDATMARAEKALLEQALSRTQGNKKRAADLLSLKRTTFSAKWRSLQSLAGSS